MAQLTGVLNSGTLATVYSRTAIQLGTRAFDESGNEYIFLKGCTSTVVGSWVVFDANNEFDTTLLAANALGPVAVAQAAIVAGKAGWYCIWGKTEGVVDSERSVLDNTTIGRTVTDGYVLSAIEGNVPAGDIMYGAICRSGITEGNTNAITTFQIYYPFVDDQTAAH